ncbi:MAG: glycosyltransferase [Acidobacteriaceae bacterium]
MRILHIISTLDPKAGGPSTNVRRIVKSYAPMGHAGEVVTLDAADTPFLKEIGFTTHALGPISSVYAYNSKLLPWLQSNLEQFDGVVVHGLWQYCGFSAWRACKGRIPYVVFTHGMLDPYFKRAFPKKHLKKWIYWLLAEYWILRNASRVLFTSEAEKEAAKESFWLHRWTPQVVPYGASAPPASPEHYRQSFLQQFPKLQGKRFLLFLGRIHPKKGCDLLLNAFAQTAHKDPALHLVFAGPDETGWIAELNKVVASNHLTDRVHWLGMVEGDHKWGAFYSSEAFVLPSHQENFGIAVAEALACAKPVLISDKVNIWEDILKDGAAIVAPDDAAGTLQLLERWLATREEERAAMRHNALKCFQSRYDMSENARSIVRLFEEITASER